VRGPLRETEISLIVEKGTQLTLRMFKPFAVVAVALAAGIPATAQDASPSAADPPAKSQADTVTRPDANATPTAAVVMLEGFKNSDVKFDLNELVDILRDRRHEGWVLAAYPDPRTSQPLIGAGFSLDLPERPHPQPDPLNPHSFLEASSADLWEAAGFDPKRLDDILNLFYERRRKWSKRTWRRQLYSLPAQISDDEAVQLVRVGAVQAIYNSRAYCRNFDQMNGPQQMAMAQLVYQMGLNLQHFNAFLTIINPDPGSPQGAGTDAAMFGQAVTEAAKAEALGLPEGANAQAAVVAPVGFDQSPEYWLSVQKSLMGSQWAHKYRTRAVAVIAMLDPAYGDDPVAAEKRVRAVLKPTVSHRRARHAAGTRQVSATKRRSTGKKSGRPATKPKNKKRV
jgi:hypothetical protein